MYFEISRAIDLNNLRINQKVNKKNIRANNRLIRFLKYDNTGQNNNIKRYAALSFTIIDWGLAHTQYRVAHIHCTVVNDNEIIADFGSWIEAYSAAGKTWFGWWLVEHYFSYHVDCPDGCVSGEPAGGG